MLVPVIEGSNVMIWS